MPWTMHQSRQTVKSRYCSMSESTALRSPAWKREETLVLAGRHLAKGHVDAPVAGRHRDDVFDAGLEGRGAEAEVAAAGGPEPVNGVEFEVVEDGFSRLLPCVLEEDALAESAALAGAVEGNDGVAEVGEGLEEGVELFDEGVIAAVEDEGADLSAFGGETEAGEVAAGVGDFDGLVAGDALDGEGVGANEVVVVTVAEVARGEEELDLMVVGSGVGPALFGLGAFGGVEEGGGPGVDVFNFGGKCFRFCNARGGFAVSERAVHGVVHLNVGEDVEKSHGARTTVRSGHCPQVSFFDETAGGPGRREILGDLLFDEPN
jgi:hypothetical protein